MYIYILTNQFIRSSLFQYIIIYLIIFLHFVVVKFYNNKMNTDWDVDMSGTGQVSGWGDDDFDIADMQEMKKNTTKKSKKKSRRLKQPLSPTSDPTAMLIKYAASRNVTESNGKSSSHVRPWSRSYDLIHRGAKLAEENEIE